MNEVLFILLFIIAIGIIYIVHRYFEKHEFFLLGIIYSIISFMLSFKLIHVFGLNINVGIVFNSFIIIILYYFINRFGVNEYKKFIWYSMISTISCLVFILITCYIFPSIYDDNIILFKGLLFDNLSMALLYPLSLLITLVLASYSFKELKSVKNNSIFRAIIYLAGIVFIDVLVCVFLSSFVNMGFINSRIIAIDNYIVKTIIIIILYLIINRIIKIKKVKL